MPVKSPEIIEVKKVVDSAPEVITTIKVETLTVETAASDFSESEQAKQLTVTEVAIESHEIREPIPLPVIAKPNLTNSNTVNVSALSLASIRAKKELAENSKIIAKDEIHLTEEFTETDMLLQWNKYAQRLADKGHKIMESFLLINDPKLQGKTIVHELPNEGSKIEFESQKHELLGYLRGKLHNHDIEIKIVVNESMDSRKAFTPQDRYNRLNEINPSLELLRKTFDLDI